MPTSNLPRMIHAPLPSAMPANKRPVRAGGLMRCCLATIAETEDETKVGDTLECKYDKPGSRIAEMVVALDGAWQWNHLAPYGERP